MSGGKRSEIKNRLSESVSPYLLQHARNPVDWYPWGSEAIEKSRREGKPIFLSIGYSACHWCHVMERECFENEKIAELMNANFVNIKVDREERPDLDEVYMLATQLLTGSGGWPMSVWLTPDLKPFYAGTYFPPTDGYGRPGFPRLLIALADAWKNKKATLLEQAEKVVEAAKHRADETERKGAGEPIVLDLALAEAIGQWADGFDPENGGIGNAPKFPPHQALALWVELLSRGQSSGLSEENLAAVAEMTTKTLDAMSRGGIYDHVGGAFARYSTDAIWLVPHFEKMLYDNAQLAPVYAIAGVALNREDYKRVARETLDFYLREMTNTQGAFYSTLDADSEGLEGKFYTWTISQIREALGADADLIIDHFNITQDGNWHEGDEAWHHENGGGANVLALAKPAEGETRKRLDYVLARMRDYRSKRIAPGLDDKNLTSWNGLMISALAISGRVLNEPKYIAAALRAVQFLTTRHMQAGKLLRVSRGAAAHTAGFLEDYAYLLAGILDLIDAGDAAIAETVAPSAVWLANVILEEFIDPSVGGFFFTGKSQEPLFVRMKIAIDNAAPSANAVAIGALLRLTRMTEQTEYAAAAKTAAESFSAIISRGPSLVPTLLRALVVDRDTNSADRAEPATARWDPSLSVLTIEPHAPINAHAGETFELALTINIADGYHIQPAHPKDKTAFATAIRVRGSLPLASQAWEIPEPQQFAELGIEGHRGQLVIIGKLQVAEGAKPRSYDLRATLLAQPCSGHSCLPAGQVSIDVTVRVE